MLVSQRSLPYFQYFLCQLQCFLRSTNFVIRKCEFICLIAIGLRIFSTFEYVSVETDTSIDMGNKELPKLIVGCFEPPRYWRTQCIICFLPTVYLLFLLELKLYRNVYMMTF
jgi:hypothetical protein